MRDVSPQSPEERLKREARARALGEEPERPEGQQSATWLVVKRVAIGVYNDGFIHAGNLAYLALLSLFPFVIVAAAVPLPRWSLPRASMTARCAASSFSTNDALPW